MGGVRTIAPGSVPGCDCQSMKGRVFDVFSVIRANTTSVPFTSRMMGQPFSGLIVKPRIFWRVGYLVAGRVCGSLVGWRRPWGWRAFHSVGVR
jgi:hypothetical protein